MSFNLFKLNQKFQTTKYYGIPKTRISRSSGCCPRIVPDSTRDFKNFMTLEQRNIMKFNEIWLQISPVSFSEFLKNFAHQLTSLRRL